MNAALIRSLRDRARYLRTVHDETTAGLLESTVAELERIGREVKKAREAMLGHAGGAVALRCLNRALHIHREKETVR